MKHLLYKIILIAALLLSATIANAQGILFGTDTTIYKGDTLKLAIDGNFRGGIQWQKSYDNTNWLDIEGATIDTCYISADSSAQYRVMITEGTCNPVYSDTAKTTVIQLAEEIIILDTITAIELISDSAQQADGNFIFEFIGEEPDIHINSILVGTKGNGYLRKVTNVTVTGDSLILETDSACLTDAMTEASIEDSILLTVDGLKKGYVNGIPVPMEVVYLPKGAGLKNDGSGIDLSNVVLIDENVSYQYNDTISGTTFTAEANLAVLIESGEIIFEPMINRKIKIGLSEIKELKLSAGGDLTFNMDIMAQCDAMVSYSGQITLAEFKYGPIALGPVPMFITLAFNAGFETGFNVAGSTTAGFDSGVGLEFGASYKKDYGWESIWNKSTSFEFHEPQWEARANSSARLYVEPEISAQVAGVAGPKFGVEPYLRLNGEIDYPDWNFELYAGFNGNLGFEVGIFDYELINYETTLANYEVVIYENSGTVDFDSPTVVTGTVTNITSSTAIFNGEVTDDGGADIISKGFVYSKNSNPSIENEYSIIVVIDNDSVFSSSVNNLESNTIYYVKAFAENSAGISYGTEKSFTTSTTSTGLVAYYPFNNNVLDDSGNENHGTINGATLTTDRFGNENSAYNFDGEDDFIFIPYSGDFNIEPTSQLTLVAWVNPSVHNISHHIITKAPSNTEWDYGLTIDNNNLYLFGHHSQHEAYSKSTAELNSWHQVVGVYDNTNWKIYIDGVLETENSASYITQSSGGIAIGRKGETMLGYFNGSIDDIRIYNRTLSSSEVYSLYANYIAPKGFIVESGNNQVILKWNSDGWNTLEKIYIHRDDELVDSLIISSIEDTIYIDSDVINNEKYEYFIISKDTIGNLSVASDTLIAYAQNGNIIAHWDFDEGVGNKLTDITGNGHNGIIYNSTWVTGIKNNALQFNGTNSEVEVPYSPDFSSLANLTIEAIVKVSDLPPSGEFDAICAVWDVFNGFNSSTEQAYRLTILTKGDTSAISIGTRANSLDGYDGHGINKYYDPFPLNEWMHVAFVWSNGYMYLYKNGNLIAEEVYTTAVFNEATTPFTIGYSIGTNNDNNTYDTHFSGYIDEIRISSEALTPSEFVGY